MATPGTSALRLLIITTVLGALLLSALLLGALLLSGCAREPAPIDPVVDDPVVDDAVHVDIGQNTEGHRLLDGWAKVEAKGELDWAWAIARRATIEVTLPHDGFQHLGLRCRVLEGVAEGQTVRVAVNNSAVGTVTLRPFGGWQTVWIRLPAETIRSGDNAVAFGFRDLRSPHSLDSSSADERELAVAFDGLHFVVGAPQKQRKSRFFASQEVTLVPFRAADETRDALSQSATAFQQRLEVTAGMSLEVAAARRCPTADPCPGSLTFEVNGHDDEGRPLALWIKTLGPESRAWIREVIDLDRFVGRSVNVSFVATADDAEASAEPVRAEPVWAEPVWAEPLLHRPSGDDRLNVVLISIDTLRADRLGAYGYSRPTSRHLDALAADGVRFDQAISQAPWTTPAHMSLMTSMYPSVHGVNLGWSDFLASVTRERRYRTLGSDVPTLADVLRGHGYRTVAVTGGTTVSASLGFARGFDRYRENFTNGFEHLTPAAETAVFDMLAAYGEAPFFLFFHTFEVHAPYIRSELADMLTDEQRAGLASIVAQGTNDPLGDYRQFLADNGLLRPEITSALYDGGIQYTDAFLGRLFEQLRTQGLLARTLIVVTSDHGEEFGDHSEERFLDAHCTTVYDELIRVPLLLHSPGQLPAGRVVDQQVELIDVAPSILDVLGLPPIEGMQGVSLLPLIRGESRPDREALSEATCVAPEIKSLRAEGFKYIYAFPPPDGERIGIGAAPTWEALFNLNKDPGEQHNLAPTSPAEVAAWRARLEDRFAAMPSTGDGTEMAVEDELLDRLRALGYVD